MISFWDIWKKNKENNPDNQTGKKNLIWFNWKLQFKIGLVILGILFIISFVNFYLIKSKLNIEKWICQDNSTWILNFNERKVLFVTPKGEEIMLSVCKNEKENEIKCFLEKGEIVFLLQQNEIRFLNAQNNLILRLLCQKQNFLLK